MTSVAERYASTIKPAINIIAKALIMVSLQAVFECFCLCVFDLDFRAIINKKLDSI
jgi:hypothetical protein